MGRQTGNFIRIRPDVGIAAGEHQTAFLPCFFRNCGVVVHTVGAGTGTGVAVRVDYLTHSLQRYAAEECRKIP